jgi:hypothetical protein
MTKENVDTLIGALQSRFAAQVEVEPVNSGGRFRFGVTSPQFAVMGQLERQDAVWAVVDQVLPREATIDISLILTYAPNELAVTE